MYFLSRPISSAVFSRPGGAGAATPVRLTNRCSPGAAGSLCANTQTADVKNQRTRQSGADSLRLRSFPIVLEKRPCAGWPRRLARSKRALIVAHVAELCGGHSYIEVVRSCVGR
jgi:hypothetical protein